MSGFGADEKANPDIEALIAALEDELEGLEARIQYQEDKHPDNCSCNDCYTPSI